MVLLIISHFLSGKVDNATQTLTFINPCSVIELSIFLFYSYFSHAISNGDQTQSVLFSIKFLLLFLFLRMVFNTSIGSWSRNFLLPLFWGGWKGGREMIKVGRLWIHIPFYVEFFNLLTNSIQQPTCTLVFITVCVQNVLALVVISCKCLIESCIQTTYLTSNMRQISAKLIGPFPPLRLDSL